MCNASSGADVCLVFLITVIYCLLSLLKTEAWAHFGVCVLGGWGDRGRGREREGGGRARRGAWEIATLHRWFGFLLLLPRAALMPESTQLAEPGLMGWSTSWSVPRQSPFNTRTTSVSTRSNIATWLTTKWEEKEMESLFSAPLRIRGINFI